MIKQLSMWSIGLGMVAVSAAAQSSIDQLAPENSVVVVSVNEFQRTMNRFKRTGLWALWNSDPVQALFEEPLNE